jgi:TRAP-type mannitol/chloroaromatic compound transport system substrate-binding protein
MKRRDFLKNTGLGLAAFTGASAAPFVLHAQEKNLPAIKWQMASSFPKSLEVIYHGAEVLARRIRELTGGKFEIQVFAAGEIAPPNGVLDAVQNNTVACGHTCSYYYHSRNKAFSLDTAVPFGLDARQMNAWHYYGEGLALSREFFAKYHIVNFSGGNTGAQMGGWFRKEIKSLNDIKGLKIRIPGFGAEVFSALGASVQKDIAGADIYSAFSSGAIDAAELVGPFDDEKQGLYNVTRFYCYPGWWEPAGRITFYVNQTMWNQLPAPYQAAFEVAAAEVDVRMLANYDAWNPPAIARLVAKGTKLIRFPDDVMKAAYKTAWKIYASEAAANPDFKKIFDSLCAFQRTSDVWTGLAENTLANFMQSQLPKSL